MGLHGWWLQLVLCMQFHLRLSEVPGPDLSRHCVALMT